MVSRLVSQGQWWRLFTAVWLHADVGHLAANATLGLMLLGLVMGRYGVGVGSLAAYFAGVVGNVGSWLLAWGAHSSLGASGMVMGCVGLLAAQSIPLPPRPALPRRRLLSGVVAGLMLFLLLGLGPGTDVVAHVGGFLAGLLLGAGLAQAPGLAGRGTVNLASGFVLAGLILIPWWEALHPARL
jgi:membrane associated rhomboid family serine protease